MNPLMVVVMTEGLGGINFHLIDTHELADDDLELLDSAVAEIERRVEGSAFEDKVIGVGWMPINVGEHVAIATIEDRDSNLRMKG